MNYWNIRRRHEDTEGSFDPGPGAGPGLYPTILEQIRGDWKVPMTTDTSAPTQPAKLETPHFPALSDM